MDERNDGQKLQKASLDGSGDAEAGGTNDVVSFERIDQVYRRLDLRIIPGGSPTTIRLGAMSGITDI